MKLGFLTACMPERSLEDVAAWAAANGYEALELAAWPQLGDRPFTASHVKAESFDGDEQERVRNALDDNGLVVSALAYYDNNLSPDAAEREQYHEHLRRCIDTAAALGGIPVGKVDNGKVWRFRGSWQEPKGQEITWPAAGKGQTFGFQTVVRVNGRKVKKTFLVSVR